MGAATMGEWSLIGTTMAPAYTEEGFEMGDRHGLSALYPEAAGDIAQLTREESP